MYGYNGITETPGCLGGSGWLGKYFKSADATSGTNYLIPAGVSIGYLKPATDYWVRIRCMASKSMTAFNTATTGSYTLTSLRGPSEWSERVKISTPPSHAKAEGEVFFGDFSELCFNADFFNMAPGLIPRNSTHIPAQASDLAAPMTNEKWGFTTFSTQWQLHNEKFAASREVEEGQGWTYPDNQAVTTINTNTRYESAGGVLKGWRFTGNCYPQMGTVRVNGGASVVTPPMGDDVSYNGSVCQLSLKATCLAAGSSPKKLEIMVESLGYL